MRLVAATWIAGLVVAGATARADAAPHDMLVFESECAGGTCELVPPVAATPRGPRLVYLNFDGVTVTSTSGGDDSAANQSRILNLGGLPAGTTVTVAPFSLGVLSDAQGMTTVAQVKSFVLAQMEAIHEPYDLFFTLERPASGNYQMVVIGSDCATIANTSCAGIAILDCSDNNPHNIGYTFPGGRTVDELVVTTAQEMAHAYGLNHTTDTADIMFPQLQTTLPNSYGAGPIPAADMPCGGATFQDSHALLLDTIGPRGQDVTPPTIAITSPASNALLAGTTTVTVDAMDEEAIARVEFELDGESFATVTAPPFQASLDEPARGQHTLLARVVDTSDNSAQDSILVFAGECVTNDDCTEENFVCQDNLCVFMEPPVLGDTGDLCENNDQCTSGICGDNPNGGPNLCTEDCSIDFDCPVGFDCAGGQCFPSVGGGDDGGNADGGNDGDEEDDSPLSCLSSSVDRRSSSAAGWLLLGLCAVLLARTRRRR